MVIHKIDNERLNQRIEEMSKIGRYKEIGVHRLALSQEDKQARELLEKWMKEEGLEIEIDQVGNMYGIRKGEDNTLSPVAFGSHLDTVAHGGRYDGALGVLAGLEVISTLNEHSIATKRPLVLVNFTNEEGARFAPDMMGSQVVSGDVKISEVYKAVDLHNSDLTFEEELEKTGYKGTKDPSTFRPHAFVEIHIEQGPILEHENFQIGVVNRVQGIRWVQFHLKGQANHAGTTPMYLRKDPSIILAKAILKCRELTAKYQDLVATTGLIESDPNVINVIPNEIRFSIDMRCPQKNSLDAGISEVMEFIKQECENEDIQMQFNFLAEIEPVIFNERIVDIIEDVTKTQDYSFKLMVSGAGHDAQLMGHVVPSAMIFIPSKGGISHNIEEYSSPEAISRGANVLLNTIIKLAED